MRSAHPRTKNLALSSASATARASPSMGAYLDSAGWVKRLPTRVILHPSGQQNGMVLVQVQCFCNNQKPIPSLDQSVARQVGLSLSKIVTPFSISSVIMSLDSLKSLSSSSSHTNGLSGFSRCQKGCIRSAMLNVYATWLTSPNQDRTSVMFLGVGKSRMACRYFPQGRTLSRVITNPANSTSGLQNVNLSGFNVMPFLPQTSSHWMAWKKLSSIVSAHRSVSSMHFVFWGMSATISSYRLEYPSPEAMYPCGVTQYLYRPHGVMNVVR